ALGALGVVILRRKMPDAPRPYKVWGYPYVPWIFITFASVYIVFTLYSDITNFLHHRTPMINSAMGVFLVATGIPGYLYWKRKRRLSASSP
ncbi:MAG TPA: hypothetical protein PLX50_05930, partial [Candidatus Aminicenantes bacterium]|nr:hypothetical protein [Candidatus Aminicenantes bacterium]